LRQRDHLADPVIDGRIILRWSLRNCGWGHGQDWSGSGQKQVVGSCNTVINLWVSYDAGNFLTSWESVSFSIKIVPWWPKTFSNLCLMSNFRGVMWEPCCEVFFAATTATLVSVCNIFGPLYCSLQLWSMSAGVPVWDI